MVARVHDELVPVPRSAVRFPLELPLPDGFLADRPETWPIIDGQLEFVGGKLLYMPPSAHRQQDTTVDVIAALAEWRRTHTEFVVGGNEAGMILGAETRGADAAVWRRDALGAYEGRYRRVPPVLAVEVQGELEDEVMLRDKAGWYLGRGVEVVWLLFPASQEIIVMTSRDDRRLGLADRLPSHPSLPGLEPFVRDLFAQVAATR